MMKVETIVVSLHQGYVHTLEMLDIFTNNIIAEYQNVHIVEDNFYPNITPQYEGSAFEAVIARTITYEDES